MDTPALSATPDEIYAYISDMLSQLADLARSVGDRKLDASIRLLALQASTDGRRDLRPKGAPAH